MVPLSIFGALGQLVLGPASLLQQAAQVLAELGTGMLAAALAHGSTPERLRRVFANQDRRAPPPFFKPFYEYSQR
jgi:hypothetical protein